MRSHEESGHRYAPLRLQCRQHRQIDVTADEIWSYVSCRHEKSYRKCIRLLLHVCRREAVHDQMAQLMGKTEPHTIGWLLTIEYYQRRHTRNRKGYPAYGSPTQRRGYDQHASLLREECQIADRTCGHTPVSAHKHCDLLGIA